MPIVHVFRFAFSIVVATALAAGAFCVPIPTLGVVRGLVVAEARADEAPKIFHGVGVVTGINAASGALTVKHGAIPGLMDAMEMDYQVRPASLSSGLQKGDTIAFGVDKSYTIVEIKKTPR